MAKAMKLALLEGLVCGVVFPLIVYIVQLGRSFGGASRHIMGEQELVAIGVLAALLGFLGKFAAEWTPISRRGVVIRAVIAGSVAFCVIAYLAALVVSLLLIPVFGLDGAARSQWGWPLGVVVGAIAGFTIAYRLVGCGDGEVIAEHAWTDLRRSGGLTSYWPWFNRVRTRIWVEKDGATAVLKRLCPWDLRGFWLVRIGLALITVFGLGRFVHRLLPDPASGGLYELVWLAVLVALLVGVYTILLRFVVAVFPWAVVSLGDWQDLEAFSVGARDDFYGGGGVDAKTVHGAVLMAHFADGRRVRIAETDHAVSRLHELHRVLTRTFIEERRAYVVSVTTPPMVGSAERPSEL